MKKFLLLSTIILCAIMLHGQTVIKPKQNLTTASYIADKHTKSSQASPAPQAIASEKALLGESSGSIVIRDIGAAANGFSLLGTRQYLWVENDINTVSFAHRMEAFPGSGYVAYDYSVDRGATFTNNIQVYDASLSGASNGRYPQGAIYNPSGNTDPAKSIFTYFAPTLDGTSGNGSWGGYAYGINMLTAVSGATQDYFTSEGEFIQDVPKTFVITKQGLVMAVDIEKPDLIYNGNLILTKGHFTSGSNGLVMERELMEMPASGQSLTGEPARVSDVKTAFSPDGMIGYIGCLSNNGENSDNSDGCYYPILYKTTDGGETWDGPFNVQLGGEDGIPAVRNFLTDEILAEMFEEPIPERDEIPFSTAFELNLSVDHTGNPHLIFNVGVGSQEWSLFTSYGGNPGCNGCVAMMHVFSQDGGESWLGDTLCTVKTFRGEFPYSGGNSVTEDNRPYVASTPDGTKMFFSWNDTEMDDAADNINPDIFCIGYDVKNNSYSEKYNVTYFTPAMWQAYMACGANNVFDHGDGSYTIPFVYQKINPSDIIDPVQFQYIDNFVLTDDDLNFTTGTDKTIEKTASIINAYPNPCSDNTTVSMFINSSAKAAYKLTSLTGQVVLSGEETINMPGQYNLTLNLSGIEAGIYIYSINVNEEIHTGKIVVN